MSSIRSNARVRITRRPLWRIRAAWAASRYLLYALAVAGLAASARFAIAPPRPSAVSAVRPSFEGADRGAEAFAALFARRYLTWNAADPQGSMHSLASFVGPGMEPGAGLVLPQAGEQTVTWVDVVQAREPEQGVHVYTVAAQTDTAGLLYLTVGVVRETGGSLALTGYPAFVGPPASGPAVIGPHGDEVTEPALETVVSRALRNYLADAPDELAADLSSDAHVSPPGLPLTLESIQRLDWAEGADSVLAVVHAADGRGTQYLLAYELDVSREQGRWEITAVQMDPDT